MSCGLCPLSPSVNRNEKETEGFEGGIQMGDCTILTASAWEKPSSTNLTYSAAQVPGTEFQSIIGGTDTALFNRDDKAKQRFMEAVAIDVKCFDAFEQLVGGEMMTPDEGKTSIPPSFSLVLR
ncbi:hypothetical protein B0H13DRAFT_2311330 [Mycena leptocephala]|nr:hypothetical protein B0H13DRAFT_2311330 [Mycena leptocephala]